MTLNNLNNQSFSSQKNWIVLKARNWGASSLLGMLQNASVATSEPYYHGIRVNIGTFRKKNGDLRTMVFVTPGYLPSKFKERVVKGPNKYDLADNDLDFDKIEKRPKQKITPILPDGMKRVWDLEAGAFRIFNYKTQVGKICSYYVPRI